MQPGPKTPRSLKLCIGAHGLGVIVYADKVRIEGSSILMYKEERYIGQILILPSQSKHYSVIATGDLW